MRISDWSSDVCSSDLERAEQEVQELADGRAPEGEREPGRTPPPQTLLEQRATAGIAIRATPYRRFQRPRQFGRGHDAGQLGFDAGLDDRVAGLFGDAWTARSGERCVGEEG